MIRRKSDSARLLAACERISTGRLRLVTPEGETHEFGPGPRGAEIELNDWAAARPILAQRPEALAESYARGLWHSRDGEAVARLFRLNAAAFPAPTPRRLPFRRPERLPGNEFFQLFLDPGMSFTAALFQTGDDDLGRAQHRKYDRVLDRLGAGPRLLDMTCGWGGLMERAAARGHEVTGVAARAEQRAFAAARLDGQAAIHLGPSRLTGRFDGIAAVEPDAAALPALLASMKAHLAEGGRALLQTVAVPGADTLPEAARQAGLTAQERFAFGADYARTFRHWAGRLDASARRAARLGVGEDVRRRWRWRFESAAAAFALGEREVVQWDLSHA
ncbi:class I SAM-dependent methyltransferase [Pseudoroseicyclus tamaricis]|uniref:Class I SAM-dependent methyltransferase n=1 Tax=Pseudoroseicyclus tamaricis TaxID=2705421 RepID=A0A6B2JJ56_9RHOB|nr:class I SAM-dependent methyltransferase [Pseudoroseicyclus tamaricis]NDV01443.1 class I SAM-dependent methyltransferase [Pseudoroseicyclus tamaricis]